MIVCKGFRRTGAVRRMLFLLNDVVLSLDLQALTPPVMASRFAQLSMASVQRLGCEMFAEQPDLQHQAPESAKRLCAMLVAKDPAVSAALFLAPHAGCDPASVGVRLANLDLQIMARLHIVQQAGNLTP